MARDGGAEQGSEVKAEMMRALKGLEGLVKEGRKAIREEKSRQEKVGMCFLVSWLVGWSFG